MSDDEKSRLGRITPEEAVFIPDAETADRLYGSAMGWGLREVFERMRRAGHFTGAFAEKKPQCASTATRAARRPWKT